jgi:hypothetical protein
MIKIEKTENCKLKIELECNYEIVSDCFKFWPCNAASEGTRAILEVINIEYKNYLLSQCKTEDDKCYIIKELDKIKIILE